jgi:hypothetical protein
MKRRIYIGIFYTAICVGIGVLLNETVRMIVLRPRSAGENHRFVAPRTALTTIPSQTGFKKYFYEPLAGSTESVELPWLGYAPTYTINSDTLNERFYYPHQKPVGTYRILTIGDSFTFGAYVNTADNFSEQLENTLNAQWCRNIRHFDVINLGVNGYDISYTVERFINRGLPYEPDLVIWLMNGHNFYQLRDEMRERENEIIRRMSPERRAYYEQTGKFYVPAVIAARDMQRRYGKDVVLGVQRNMLRQFSEAYRGPVLLAFFSQGMDETIKGMVSEFAEGRNAPTYLFNGLPDLSEMNGALPDSHPNTYGHKMIANNLFAYLLANNLYTCND